MGQVTIVGEVIRTDGSNRFAWLTMTERLPGVVASVLQSNLDYDRATARYLRDLAAAVRDNGGLPLLAFPAPDGEEWAGMVKARRGQSWLSTDWFFAEMYFYRQVLAGVRWWETGVDPYGVLKNRELLNPAVWQWLAEAEASSMAALWSLVLWGNRCDLSHPTALTAGAPDDWTEADMLIDDRALLVDYLDWVPGPVHYVADNVGTELAMDLALISRALQQSDRTVYLHVKLSPVLVSDATAADVWRFVEFLKMSVHTRLAGHLEQMLRLGRLRIAPDPFWSSGLPMTAMPDRLREAFSRSALVVFKGDMNYRRLVGDVLVPCSVPLSAILDNFPCAVAAVRTLKSDPL